VPETFIADLEPDGSEGTILIEIDQATRSYAVSYRDTTFVLATKNRGLPGPPVVIESVFPMPPGPDRLNEAVTLRNVSGAPVS
jgi:hypothetical protein